MFKTRLRRRPRIEIIPMIDVIFFLLVFFMLFTTFKTTPHGLDIQLPQAVTATQQQEDQIVSIYINQHGEIYYDESRVSIGELGGALASRQQEHPNLVSLIQADQQTPYNYVVQVMDLLRELGLYRISFGAEPPSGD